MNSINLKVKIIKKIIIMGKNVGDRSSWAFSHQIITNHFMIHAGVFILFLFFIKKDL